MRKCRIIGCRDASYVNTRLFVIGGGGGENKPLVYTSRLIKIVPVTRFDLERGERAIAIRVHRRHESSPPRSLITRV